MSTTINITYNQLIDLFESFQTRHQQLNTFYEGNVDQLGNSQEIVYPLLAVIPTDVRMIKGNQSYNSIEYRFTIIGGDLLQDDHSNERDVRSDMLLVLQDLISEFNQTPYYNENGIIINSDSLFQPFTERFDDLITGWAVNISIKVPYRGTPCNAPISPTKTGNDLTGTC